MGGGGDDAIWLVSYADLMTLLFGFFVLMFFFANEDKKDNWEKVRKEMAEYFGGTYVNPNADLATEIEKVLQDTPFKDDLEVRVFEEGLEVTFRSTVLFESGSADFTPQAIKPLNLLVEVISSRLKALHARIVVEGHTDDRPIATKVYPSNWELSAARATGVLRLFEKNNIPTDLMRAVAFGESRPLFPNKDDNGVDLILNQAKNRRVVIRVIATMAPQLEEEAAAANATTLDPAAATAH
jgi:chemotaxis protein MotB